MITLGEKVLLSRRDLGLTQAEVAERANVSRSHIANIETERVTNVGIDVIAALADVLEVSRAYLLGITDDPLAGMNESTFTVLQTKTRAINDWPANVQKLAELASQLPDEMVLSLIDLARQCAESRQSDRERIVEGLIEASRRTFGDAVADQLKTLVQGAIDDRR